MIRKWIGVFLTIVVVGASSLGAGLQEAAAATHAQWGGITYASLADEAAVYLNDMVFVRDQVVLPPGEARVLLPPGTYPDTLILTENGARVRAYRVTAQPSDVYYSQANYRYGTGTYTGGGSAYVLTWDAPTTEDTRAITLEYLMSGASWTPTYDMQIVNESTVNLAFFAQVNSTGLVLEDATVYLVAGRVDLSQQVDQRQAVTFNQYAVGYADQSVSLPSLGTGAVELQHIYAPVSMSVAPGDTLFTNLADANLTARRLHVWNASASGQVDVIYKVMNTTEVPLAQGIVRIYQDALFMGSDFIETTPVGSEGSVTAGHLPDVRVNRTESEEYHGEGRDDYYLHTITLEVQNFGETDLTLSVLDVWLQDAWQFEYSVEPVRDPNNILRWDTQVAAGGSLTITYSFQTQY